MPLRQNTDMHGIRIGIWEIDESEETLLNFFGDKVAVLGQISAVTNLARRREKLAVRILLKTLTGEEKMIVYLPSGKPELADKSFNISISHTEGFAVLALHPEQNIGIDIEHISDRAERLLSRFLSLKEREALDKGNSTVVSLLCWSAKETVYKLLSREGVDFANDIFIHPFRLIDNKLMATEYHTGKKRKFILDFEVTAQYVLTVGIEG